MNVLDEARDLLGAWREGLARDEAVVAWADEAIEQTPSGSAPEWLLDLSMYGPAKCMIRPSSEFIVVPVPSYSRALAIRVGVLDLAYEEQLQRFVKWASGACMGEDLDQPEVRFGYQLDHLWGDCDRMDLAVELVRSELPSLRTRLPRISARVLRAITGA